MVFNNDYIIWEQDPNNPEAVRPLEDPVLWGEASAPVPTDLELDISHHKYNNDESCSFSLREAIAPISGGTCELPAIPTLTAVSDNDGNVTFTVSGSSAGTVNTIKYMNKAAGAWVTGDSRSDDGDVVMALPAGFYWAHIHSEYVVGGGVSLSPVISFASDVSDYVVMVEEAILELLQNSTTLISYVGNKIYPQLAPQAAENPVVVYQRVTTEHQNTLTLAAGLAKAIIQVDSYADGYLDCKRIADAVRVALTGYKGTVQGIRIDAIYISGTNDSYTPPQDGGEKPTRRETQSFTVVYAESIPEF